MNPVIKQGILQLLYSTFLHNNEIIALGTGILLSFFLLFRQPKRLYLFFLIGFTSLLIRFEYLKHIVDPLQRQTIGVVVTEEGHLRTRRLIDIFLNNLVPLIMYFVGWGSIFVGLFLSSKSKKTK